jgi:[NiFe] hydrogenase large subunit
MSPNVVIDPVTRIEGHLRVECQVDNGFVSNAWVSCSLFRGMESVMLGRTPTDAFYLSQRICGVCPVSHGHAASMAAEAALGIAVPDGARLVRNIIEAAQFLQSHILWFYTLAMLDYVDASLVLNADVAGAYTAAVAANTGVTDFAAAKTRLSTLMSGTQVSLLTNGWFKHPAYAAAITPELTLVIMSHYIEALEMQAEAARIIAIMGGKFPHFMTSLPGGTAWVPTEENLGDVLFRLERVAAFVNGTMLPDMLAIAPAYADALKYGGGYANFVSWGVFDRESLAAKDRFLPPGMLMTGSLAPLDVDASKVREYVKHAFHDDADTGHAPASGKTDPVWPKDGYQLSGKYTWSKAPRYDGSPVEAGPLARMLSGYVRQIGGVSAAVDQVLAKIGTPGRPEVLISLLGRVAAKPIEATVVANWALEWVRQLIGEVKGGSLELFQPTATGDGSGAGLWEAPRGALGHWMSVAGGRIDGYQVVTPSTWNLGGRDDNGQLGVLEKALIGTPCVDITRPLEPLRVVRSFDPCVGCAVHVSDLRGSKRGVAILGPRGVA